MKNIGIFGSVKMDTVCFGDNDWWYHNRGHMDIQLMKRFARIGKVLYINSVVVRKFNILEGTMFFRRVARKCRSIFKGVKTSEFPNMMIYSPFTLPVHHIGWARNINAYALKEQVNQCIKRLKLTKPLIWVVCPGAAEAALKLPYAKLVYQRSDCYEEFPGVDTDQIRRYDQLLKEHADLVVYVNRSLMDQERPQCRRSMFLDHGVDIEVFTGAHLDPYVPEDIKQIPHPILGFYGSIDRHTSNICLVEQLADLLKDMSIVLIGNSSVDLTKLALRKNVFLLGQKPYEDIAHYGKCFDVCFMPWQENAWIAACNPVKLKEYLALGKPIVSTPFSELERYNDLVQTATDPITFAQNVRQVLQEDNEDRVKARREAVVESSWDAKAQQVLEALF